MNPEEANGHLDQAYLDKLNYLHATGADQDLAALRNENHILDNLLNDAAKLYEIRTVEGIMGFVTARILDQFIPTYLLVALEPPRSRGTVQYCYANLKPSEDRLSAEAYEALKPSFAASPYAKDYADLSLPGWLKAELERFDPAIIIPLCGIEGPYGLAVFGHKVRGDPYTGVERMYIDKFGRFVSIGIQNTLHYESSITDPKTGLYNHAYFTQRLEQEIARVIRHRVSAGVIMLDVDHFKQFNDKWGHLAGDAMLDALARTLKGTVRSEDVASRFGGEEFCILAVECGDGRLMEMAERVRQAIAGMVVEYKAERLSITVSLGCCLVDSEIRVGSSFYLEMADKALYISKSQGRNRSTLYRPSFLDRAEAARKLG